MLHFTKYVAHWSFEYVCVLFWLLNKHLVHHHQSGRDDKLLPQSFIKHLKNQALTNEWHNYASHDATQQKKQKAYNECSKHYLKIIFTLLVGLDLYIANYVTTHRSNYMYCTQILRVVVVLLVIYLSQKRNTYRRAEEGNLGFYRSAKRNNNYFFLLICVIRIMENTLLILFESVTETNIHQIRNR